MQLKIAIIGAPGSGKSTVARKAQSLLKVDNPKWAVVDGYINELTRKTGITFGAGANFPHNFSVITTRWIKEAEHYHNGVSTITCGTIYESILYSTFPTMFKTPEEMNQNPREQLFNQVMMQMLGAIESTTYDYDAMFFLPYATKDIPTDESKFGWDHVVNAKLPEVLDAFQKKVVLLDQKTAKAKAETIVEVVKKLEEFYANIAPTNDQPAV